MSPMLTPKIPGLEPLQSGTGETAATPPTLLIRVYGPSTGTLIERDEELRILHTLSTDYGLGPRIEGTFTNGRVEQFFPSHALTPTHLRDPECSLLIARRMRELHSVDLDALGFEDRAEPTVWQRLREWIPLAVKSASALESVPEGREFLRKFGLDRLEAEIEEYIQWVNAQEGKGKARVFCRESEGWCSLKFRANERDDVLQITTRSMATSSSWKRRCLLVLLNTINSSSSTLNTPHPTTEDTISPTISTNGRPTTITRPMRTR